MIEWITDPLSHGFFLRAAMEFLVLAPLCGGLGVWLVVFRQEFAAESLSHGALPIIVLAAILGIPFGIGAVVGVIFAALLVALLARTKNLDRDVAIAAATSTLLGLGVLIALSTETQIRLDNILFGDPLAITKSELLVSSMITTLTCLLLFSQRRRLKLVAFDEAAARFLGASAIQSELIILGVLAFALVGSILALGNLLTLAVLIAPAAAANIICSSLQTRVCMAAALTLLGGLIGLYVSYYADLAAGASTALVLVAIFLLCKLTNSIKNFGQARRAAPSLVAK